MTEAVLTLSFLSLTSNLPIILQLNVFLALPVVKLKTLFPCSTPTKIYIVPTFSLPPALCSGFAPALYTVKVGLESSRNTKTP
ncbi:hypothetical protein HOY82DRAFT_165600 [Tuber indicum]|nr:hypothetical protein HOY82DRAFT_165600 [Tuber indicum]